MPMRISVLERQARDHGLFQLGQGRGEILRKAESQSFEAMMNNPKDVARITKWIQREGRLEQFRLTLEVEATMRERERREREI